MLKDIFTKRIKIKDIPLAATDNIDLNNVPQHVAIIMDGNGRWAKEQGKIRTFGHSAGAQTLRSIVKIAEAVGVKVLSVYAFSTENWKRPITEVNFIMNLLSEYLTGELDELNEYNVKMRFMGDKDALPKAIQKKMDYAIKITENNTGIILNVAINYGGQDEIIRAVKNIATLVQQGKMEPKDINKEVIENNLYSRQLPPPDLLIRTGGDLRVSNFMLWQIAYAEIWTCQTYWPAFTQENFLEALESYQKRDRRYGGLNKK
jgi:undecaprenyl diphosphate synthase